MPHNVWSRPCPLEVCCACFHPVHVGQRLTDHHEAALRQGLESPVSASDVTAWPTLPDTAGPTSCTLSTAGSYTLHLAQYLRNLSIIWTCHNLTTGLSLYRP